VVVGSGKKCKGFAVMIHVLAIGFNTSTLDSGCNAVGAILGITLVVLIAVRLLLRVDGDEDMLPSLRRIDRVSIPLGLAFVVVSGLRIVLALST